VDSPTVEPASGGLGVPTVSGYFTESEAVGYQVEEFFLSGSAHSYTSLCR
jgi:hypothetical protein